jgi:hypothetical protein
LKKINPGTAFSELEMLEQLKKEKRENSEKILREKKIQKGKIEKNLENVRMELENSVEISNEGFRVQQEILEVNQIIENFR